MNFNATSSAMAEVLRLFLKKIPLVMKLIVLMMFIGFLTASANGFSQVTLHERNASLEQVFKELRKQTDYTFIYESETVAQQKVSIDLNNLTINEALDALFKNRGLNYQIVEKTVVVKKEEASLLQKITDLIAPPITVHGIISGDNGPLPGATILVKGANKVTSSDLKGQFSISGLKEDDILVVSYIGYEKQEVSLQSKKTDALNIQLKLNENKLDQVQIVAYGQKTSERISTGSITKITAEDISKEPATNVLEVLSGQVPGMLITQSSGTPGSAINVQIRAATALPSVDGVPATGVAPLYIVDGVTFLSEPVYTAGGNTNGYLQPSAGNSPLNAINPGDIESIEVLKDADATAIYGSRGANGVILITTKKGKAGNTKLDVNVDQGIKDVADLHRTKNMTLDQYLEVRRTAFANSGQTPTNSNAPDLTIWDTTKSRDFQKLLMGKTAQSTDANLSFSGGNSQTNFLLSGTYHDETTVIPGNYNYDRGSVHMAVEHTSPDKKLTINLNATLTLDANNNVTSNLANNAFTMAPDFPLYTTGTNLYWFNLNTYDPAYENPLKYIYSRYTTKDNNLIGGIMLKYTPVEGLNLKINTSYNKLVADAQNLNYSKSISPYQNTLPYASFQQNSTESWIVEPQADYTKKIAKGTLNVLAGATLQDNKYTQPFYLIGTDYSSDALIGSTSAAGSIYVYNFESEYKYQSLYGRANYNWLNKYILNINYRLDGSSKFGANNRTGSFGSAGAAWIFSEENAVKAAIPLLSYGKIRSSYGITGNDQIPNYQYLDTYGSTYSYGSVSGIVPNHLSNPNLKWEVNKKLEIALDLGFLKDRILLTSTWFLNRTNNPLVSDPIPSITGFTSYYANLPATIQQKGLEFTLTSQNIKSENIHWTTAFNISFDQSKLVSFPTIANTGYYNYLQVGQSMSEIYAYHYTGISPVTHLPTILDANKNGSTDITTETGIAANGGLGDRVPVGKTDPGFFGGLNNSFRYKNFQLDVLLQGTGKSMQYDIDYYTASYAPGYSAINMSSSIWKLFQETDGKIATRTFGYNTDGSAYNSYIKWLQSDAVLSNASYLRVKNVAFSYTFKPEWIKRLKMSSAQIFLQGQNLFTYTKFNGYDPESPASNIPPLRTIIIGIKFSL